MQKNTDLQDLILTRAKTERRNVTLFLMNGFQLRGQIVGFDPFVVVVNTDGKQQMIYKHAISTISPETPIPLEAEEPGAI